MITYGEYVLIKEYRKGLNHFRYAVDRLKIGYRSTLYFYPTSLFEEWPLEIILGSSIKAADLLCLTRILYGQFIRCNRHCIGRRTFHTTSNNTCITGLSRENGQYGRVLTDQCVYVVPVKVQYLL